MTPDHCDVCNEPLPPGAKACSNCGEVYTPDAKSAQDTLEEDLDERKETADALEIYKILDKLEKLQKETSELLAELDL